MQIDRKLIQNIVKKIKIRNKIKLRKLLKEISKTAESKCKIREGRERKPKREKEEQWHSEDAVQKRKYNNKNV